MDKLELAQEAEVMPLDLNPQFKKGLHLIEETNKNVFITGKAGTGKSTLLEHFRNITRKKIVVLAPTGVAAVNVKGQTIHSFFRFKPDITPEKIKHKKIKKDNIFKKIETIVIDEISMVRADLLDCVDLFLRKARGRLKKPFGGVQMVFIGDLYQLPPVVKSQERELFKEYYKGSYFFNAKVFQQIDMEFVELEKIYRQKDDEFINILNSIRNGTISDKEIEVLNKCVGKKFPSDEYSPITLTTINKKAESINNLYLNKLSSKIFTYKAKIKGEFDKNSYPTDEVLYLAKGAQVMLLNNDGQGRWINGTIAKVVNIVKKSDFCDSIFVRLPANTIEEITPYRWEIFNFKYNKEKDIIESEITGTFTQYPLKLAWAITIHKSQGKTFERVILDLSRGMFAPGQAYVALSRCVSLEGLSLTRPFKKSYCFTDREMVKFLTKYQYELTEKNISLEQKRYLIEEAIKTNSFLEILYLKPNGDKTRRIIKPYQLGKMQYNGKSFLGLEGYCQMRKEDRIFRVDRILELQLSS